MGDGSLCASGGKDAKAMLWDLNDGKHLYTLDHGDTINSLCFSPNRYWLCAATGPTIKIWDLESKNPVDELKPEVAGSARADPPQCLAGVDCRHPLSRILVSQKIRQHYPEKSAN